MIVIAIWLLGACGSDSDPASPARAPADLPAGDATVVERHIDGDTIGVRGGTSVRLIGVDTPETKHPSLPVQCFGREASAFTAELLPIGTEVRLVYDVERRDRYNRTLAYIYRVSDGLFVNAELLRQGYAQVATFPPNVAHVGAFLELQAEARAEGRGLWGACGGNTLTGQTGRARQATAPGHHSGGRDLRRPGRAEAQRIHQPA